VLLATFPAAPAHHQTKPYTGKEQKVRSKTSSAAHLFVHCFTCRNHYRSYHRILQNAVVTNRMKTCCIFYCFIFTRKEEQARLRITQKLRGGKRPPCDPCRVRSGYAPQLGTFWAANQDLTPIAHNPFTLYKQSLHLWLQQFSPIAYGVTVVLLPLFPGIRDWI
jgi:hypothetical protein